MTEPSKEALIAQAEALEDAMHDCFFAGCDADQVGARIERKASSLRAKAECLPSQPEQEPTEQMVKAGAKMFDALTGKLAPSASSADKAREIFLAMTVLRAQERSEQEPVGEQLHPKTAEYLKKFTHAMAEKLHAAEKKYGYSDGWLTADWQDECVQHMHKHIDKGDARDVANYCMFMWARGWATARSQRDITNADYLKHRGEQIEALVIEKQKLENALSDAQGEIANLKYDQAALLAQSQAEGEEPFAVLEIVKAKNNREVHFIHGIPYGKLALGEYQLFTHPAKAAPVPEGWQLVPKEATHEMKHAGSVAAEWPFSDRRDRVASVYKALLAAAPTYKD